MMGGWAIGDELETMPSRHLLAEKFCIQSCYQINFKLMACKYCSCLQKYSKQCFQLWKFLMEK